MLNNILIRNQLLDLSASEISSDHDFDKYNVKLAKFEKVAEPIINLYEILKTSPEQVQDTAALLSNINNLHNQLGLLSVSDKDHFNYCNMLKFKLTACEYMLCNTSNSNLLNKLTSKAFSYEASDELFTKSMSFAKAQLLHQMERNKSSACTIL